MSHALTSPADGGEEIQDQNQNEGLSGRHAVIHVESVELNPDIATEASVVLADVPAQAISISGDSAYPLASVHQIDSTNDQEEDESVTGPIENLEFVEVDAELRAQQLPPAPPSILGLTIWSAGWKSYRWDRFERRFKVLFVAAAGSFFVVGVILSVGFGASHAIQQHFTSSSPSLSPSSSPSGFPTSFSQELMEDHVIWYIDELGIPRYNDTTTPTTSILTLDECQEFCESHWNYTNTTRTGLAYYTNTSMYATANPPNCRCFENYQCLEQETDIVGIFISTAIVDNICPP